ncbi:hypothetical protein BCR33DRAFT_725654 [Rhizoclosmatium globosum]|uniref:Uncharacterized protein n=1 Tax=Rhizoclosmatium globosum TaxID=329046 RepID=A0A1Y2AXT9_9FUNG|nr:hypothetical protein BCR33DRAFT_725654 [Rhizoclosmatium globosum]|eukprot:ORY27306.1 hypothetical protein BCR33DRAFT_725654 [Rhizoclosmatium globosum]
MVEGQAVQQQDRRMWFECRLPCKQRVPTTTDAFNNDSQFIKLYSNGVTRSTEWR